MFLRSHLGKFEVLCQNFVTMASALNRILREDERQEKLLEVALHAADALDAVRSRSLYRHVAKRVEADAAGSSEPKPVAADKPTSKPSKSNGEGHYTKKAEEYVFANGKKGVTTREVSNAIGQSYGSADGTLRHVAEKWKTIVRRDDKWFPVPNAKRRADNEGTITIGQAITTTFHRNGNTPLAAKDIFKGVKAVLPAAKKGSVDAQLVAMRKNGTLVQNGTAPHGGGLYHLATGGADAANVN
jgi:hypothetical protein